MATRKLNLIEARADAAGLAVATWSPGDGATRYRFFKKAPDAKHPYADYSEGGHLKTLMGKNLPSHSSTVTAGARPPTT